MGKATATLYSLLSLLMPKSSLQTVEQYIVQLAEHDTHCDASLCLDNIESELSSVPLTEDWFNSMPENARGIFRDIVHSNVKAALLEARMDELNLPKKEKGQGEIADDTKHHFTA